MIYSKPYNLISMFMAEVVVLKYNIQGPRVTGYHKVYRRGFRRNPDTYMHSIDQKIMDSCFLSSSPPWWDVHQKWKTLFIPLPLAGTQSSNDSMMMLKTNLIFFIGIILLVPWPRFFVGSKEPMIVTTITLCWYTMSELEQENALHSPTSVTSNG